MFLSENLSKEEKGMSRIGRMPVAIPAGVTVEIAEGNKVTVKGRKRNSGKRASCLKWKSRSKMVT